MTKHLIEKGTNYSYLIDALKKPSFESLRQLSVKFVNQLPEEVRTELWEDLANGVEVLESEALLSMYMFAYGKMHAAKLQAAFEYLPANKLSDIHIIDWGCGQAMATVVYYEYLRENDISSNVKTITLIEPSELALKRAALHSRKLFANAEIKTIKKGFDKVTKNDIQIDDNQTVLHLFSNVLDIECFNIEKLAELIQENNVYNLLVCVSPYINDFKNERLKDFISFFESANTLANYVNKKWHNGWTIDYKVVEVNFTAMPDCYNSDTYQSETVTDIDSNVYKTVKIGNQIWMTENLRVSRYRNGDIIPNVIDNNEWSNLKSDACCNYQNNKLLSKLYNWKAVDDKRGLAPEGWHIPSEQEWFILTQNLEIQDLIYRYKISNKSIFGKWFKDYKNGFSELVSECRDIFGAFYNLSYEGAWWNTSGKEASDAWLQMSRFKTSLPDFDDLTGIWESYQRANAFCVRCIKDSETIIDLNTEVNEIDEIDESIEINIIDGYFGAYNSLGEIIIPHKYDEIDYYYEGYARVKKNNRWGFVNTKGEEIIPAIFQYVTNFNSGLSKIVLENKWGIINKQGIVIIPIIYDTFENEHYDLIRVESYKKWGILGKYGNIIISCKYDFLGKFNDGLAKVKLDGRYGYIDIKGNMVIPFQFHFAGDFNDGIAKVRLDGRCGYIDIKGNVVIPFKFIIGDQFNNGLAKVMLDDGKWGYIDKLGKVFVGFQYDGISGFCDGLAAVKLKNKFGFIDLCGNIIIPIKYDSANAFSDGMAVVKLNNKFGYIDLNENIIIPFKYDIALSFKDGLAIVRKEDCWFIIDKRGEVLVTIDEQYDYIDYFYDELAKVTKDDKIGFINKKGILIIPLIYKRLIKGPKDLRYNEFNSGFARVLLNEKYGIIDKKGNWVKELDLKTN